LPDSRLVRTNQDRRVRSAASEMSPQSMTVKAHMKHCGPLPKIGFLGKYNRGNPYCAIILYIYMRKKSHCT
jgi:hypothetical protein